MKKLLKKLWKYLKPFTNWKFLISFGLAWFITNGWCYLFIVLGPILKWKWMTIVGSSYAAFLYFPLTVEKPITIAISIFLQTKIFPKDIKLHNSLLDMKAEAKKDWESVKKKVKNFRIKMIMKRQIRRKKIMKSDKNAWILLVLALVFVTLVIAIGVYSYCRICL